MEAPGDYVSQFDEMFAVAYRAAFAVLGDRGDAEDCAQDSLAKALVRWRRVHEHAIPWVARVSANSAIDRWRKRRRSTPVAAPSGHTDKSDGTDPLAIQRNDLVRALRVLPRRQRDAVVLRHLLDLSERDTASALWFSSPAELTRVDADGVLTVDDALIEGTYTWARR